MHFFEAKTSVQQVEARIRMIITETLSLPHVRWAHMARRSSGSDDHHQILGVHIRKVVNHSTIRLLNFVLLNSAGYNADLNCTATSDTGVLFFNVRKEASRAWFSH
jgi:hypothetical protein